MKSKTFNIITVIGMLLLIGGFVGINVYVDPLFHYHAPNPNIAYPIYEERYTNDGIVRNFDYDSIITGTSMTQNFKASLWDELFGTKSVKVPAAGARYKETNDVLARAYKHHDGQIKTVLRSLDLSLLVADKDFTDYDGYPEYLYDDNIFNDVYYVLNKEVFYDFTAYTIQHTLRGYANINMDVYKRWGSPYLYDIKEPLGTYTRPEKQDVEIHLTDADRQLIAGNLNQNVISLIKQHPETEFYLFFPPYSILYWDDQVRQGRYDYVVEMQQMVIEMLLPLENVHLYSFFDDYLLVSDLRNYQDSMHYGLLTSDEIMRRMKNGEGLLTKENYMEYLQKLYFYKIFDYDTFFEERQ